MSKNPDKQNKNDTTKTERRPFESYVACLNLVIIINVKGEKVLPS